MAEKHHAPDDPEVISWDVLERRLTDGSCVHDVVGTSDQCRVTFYCADERTAEELAAMLNSRMVCGAQAERLIAGSRVVSKKCSRCHEEYPADPEFFRVRTEATVDSATKYVPWCRACEAEQKASSRAIANNVISKAANTPWPRAS